MVPDLEVIHLPEYVDLAGHARVGTQPQEVEAGAKARLVDQRVGTAAGAAVERDLVGALGRVVCESLAAAGAAVGDPRVQAEVDALFASVSRMWTPNADAFAGLGRMYAEDPRFRATYDAVSLDLADYFRLNVPKTRPVVAELAEEGLLLPARVEGWKQPLPLAGCPSLHQSEVEERDRAIGVEPVVARMRVAVEHAVLVHRALREAEHHLGGALAEAINRIHDGESDRKSVV